MLERKRGITRREFIRWTALTASGLVVDADWAQGAQPSLALVNGRIIDGTGAGPIPDGAVMIQNGRITAVGSREQMDIPSEAERIDVQGNPILPGFINAHVHLGFSAKRLKAWAKGGVTSVRDLGMFGAYNSKMLKEYRMMMSGDPKTARLVAVGSFVNAEGGYPIAKWNAHAVTVSTTDEARQAVNMLIDDGAEVIKTAFESGYAFGTSGWPLLKPDTAKALVEAAHGRGTPVTAHVTSARDLDRALDAGVDEIAHMVVDELADDQIARVIETRTRWTPTIELWQGVSRVYPVDYGNKAVDNLARVVQAGGEIILGTDFAGAPGVKFDLGMTIREIEWMRKAGMSPMGIIVAATKNAARACNMENKIGTLEPGRQADILVVTGDPLSDLKALNNTYLVLRDGEIAYIRDYKQLKNR